MNFDQEQPFEKQVFGNIRELKALKSRNKNFSLKRSET